MSAQIRRYVKEREHNDYLRGLTPDEYAAATLRQEFVKKFIVNFDTNLYKTQEERDWGYIAKREYNYDVYLKGFAYSFMGANLVCSWRIFIRKGMVWWPLFVVTPISYLYWGPVFSQKHSKKHFDMCNIGEQYYLGKKRNEVLRKCNEILDVQDF